jgi:hypothetical protein
VLIPLGETAQSKARETILSVIGWQGTILSEATVILTATSEIGAAFVSISNEEVQKFS